MNLKQIIRNQKLSNFNYKLTAFISEADDDEEVTKKDAFAGKTDAKVPKEKYWYVKDGDYKARVNHPGQGWELADKKKAEKAEEEKDIEVDIDDETRDDINADLGLSGLTPDPEDENVFVDEDGNQLLQISGKGNIVPAGAEGELSDEELEPYAQTVDDLNKKFSGDEEDEKDDEDDEEEKEKTDDEKTKANLNPATEPKDDKDISDFMRLKAYPGLKKGQSGPDRRSESWAPTTDKMKADPKRAVQHGGSDPMPGTVTKNQPDGIPRPLIDINNTPQGKPPSDAAARQTALDTGFPKSGTEPWPASEVTGMDAAPAPGTVGSMMNEIFSVEGCNIAEKFYEEFGTVPTVEDMVKILGSQLNDTTLANQNGSDAPPGSKAANDYQKKLKIAAQASITKFERLQNAEANNKPPKDPPFGKMIRPPSQFYGAEDSIEAQAEMIRRSTGTIFGPDGPITEITNSPRSRAELEEAMAAVAIKGSGRYDDDKYRIKVKGKWVPNMDAIKAEVDDMLTPPNNKDPERIRQFAELLAYAGGGGANPSDTATFAQDEHGNLMILFHSDKMDTGDQQGNSTFAKEARVQELYVEEMTEGDSPSITEEQAAEAKVIMDDINERVAAVRATNDSPELADRLLKFKGKKKKAIMAAVWEDAAGRTPNPVEKAGFSKDNIEDYVKYISNMNPPDTPNVNQSKTINNVLTKMAKSGFSEDELASIDATAIGSAKTAKIIKLMNEKRTRLDKIKTGIKGPDGEPRGLGQVLEGKNIIDKLHLYGLNDHTDLAYQSGMCATVIGNDIIDKKTLRGCLGVDNTDDLLGKLITESPTPPKDDYIDDATGLPNSMLQRSTKSFERNEDGQIYYWIVDENKNKKGKIANITKKKEKELAEEGLFVQKTGKGKNEKPVSVGVSTGEKISYTFMMDEDERFTISLRTGRSKAGPGQDLETTYTLGKSMQDCIKEKGQSELQEGKIKKGKIFYGLSNILSETQENTLAHHWKIAEDNYPLALFIKELNESSLN
jgi:hypothetical protein